MRLLGIVADQLGAEMLNRREREVDRAVRAAYNEVFYHPIVSMAATLDGGERPEEMREMVLHTWREQHAR